MKYLLLTLLALTGCISGPVQAQNFLRCAVRDTAISGLARDYGETQIARGLSEDGNLVEIFVSEQTGSWTIVVTAPGGLACGLESGGEFEFLFDDLPVVGDPT